MWLLLGLHSQFSRRRHSFQEKDCGLGQVRRASPPSEQMIIDCTMEGQTSYEFPSGNNYQMGGCDGGWMEYAWWLMAIEGAITEADYPN